MRKEIRIFFTALMFYSRIPVPKNIDHSQGALNKASRYFPLIGWIVGILSFLVYQLAVLILPIDIAVLFSLFTGVLITGAFHEDGLGDVFDGFGGGWTKERILEIMKDSRMGAFGVIALIFLLFIKFSALNHLMLDLSDQSPFVIALVFVNYHAIARLTAVNIVFTSSYARLDATSKVKPIAKSHGLPEYLGSYFFGLLPLITLSYFHLSILFTIIPLAILAIYARNYFNRKLGGYTGDCLGAVEQIAECICLLSLIILWKFM